MNCRITVKSEVIIDLRSYKSDILVHRTKNRDSWGGHGRFHAIESCTLRANGYSNTSQRCEEHPRILLSWGCIATTTSLTQGSDPEANRVYLDCTRFGKLQRKPACGTFRRRCRTSGGSRWSMLVRSWRTAIVIRGGREVPQQSSYNSACRSSK